VPQSNPGLGDAIPLGLVGATALALGGTGGKPRRVGLLCSPTVGDATLIGLWICFGVDPG
jgi:hypothetical protein